LNREGEENELKRNNEKEKNMKKIEKKREKIKEMKIDDDRSRKEHKNSDVSMLSPVLHYSQQLCIGFF
jgi:hypothetical protein